MSAPLPIRSSPTAGDRHWSREVLADENGHWIARVPELPGCFADGNTYAEALATLDKTVEEWLSVRQYLGKPVPEPRIQASDQFSGRFSVRLPRSLHRHLSERAEAEGCSLNQLVTHLLTLALARDEQPSHEEESTIDAHEQIASDAVAGGKSSIGALKGVATFLKTKGSTNLAAIVYAFAARVVADGEGREAAAKEAGMAAAMARREGSFRVAEALWRESLRYDATNLRSASALGQLLHHQGRFDEAIEWLERAKIVDQYASLFYGWSLLERSRQMGDDAGARDGLKELTDSLRKWAYQNGDRRGRTSWIRHLQRLRLSGEEYAEEVEALREFANSQSNWEQIGAQDITTASVVETDQPWAPVDVDGGWSSSRTRAS